MFTRPEKDLNVGNLTEIQVFRSKGYNFTMQLIYLSLWEPKEEFLTALMFRFH